MIIDYAAIGLRVKIARIKIKMTQQRLAEKAGLSVVHISNIENGNAKLSLEAAVNIANALSVTTDDLLCDNLVHAFHVYNKEAQEIFGKSSERNAPVLVRILEAASDALEQEDRFQERLNSKKDD